MKTVFLLLALVTSVANAQLLDVYSDTAKNLNFTGRVNMAKAANIPTASVVDLSSAAGNLVHIVGSTTITSFGTPSQAGICRDVIFDNIVAITYNASTLVIPGNTTLTAQAGDHAFICADSATKWIILDLIRQATAP